jgi:DNA (cytosine-5)-methyltransferase 1
MRYLSVCSGIEAASVAWHDFGWEAVGFSEIERFPSEVLAKRFPDVKNYGDMTRYKEWDIDGDSVDLLVGGTPCQAFSVAGLRKGLEDPRGNLSLTFVGMVDHFKPEWVVWENVPGVLSSNGGRDFGSFIGAMASIGYGFAWRVLDAQYFGVPQRRRRVFLVGHSSGDSRRAGEVLFEPESLSGDTTKGRTKGQGSTRISTSSVDANGIPKTVGTICADTHPGAYSGQDAYTGRLIPVLYQNNQTDARLKEEPHTSQTVLARWGTGEGNAPIVQHTYRKSRRAQSAEDFETWVPDEVTNTLNCFDVGDVRSTDIVIEAPRTSTNIASTLRANPGSGFRSDGTPVESVVYEGCRVRRLTPTECERLQGFPDGWTDVRTNTPDSPRYKAVGNSMAVPVMRHIGNRIRSV